MKTRTLFGTLIALFLMISLVFAQENAPKKLFSGPELDFFCAYMLDREFVILPQEQPSRRLMDNGRVETDFDRKTRFANLTVSAEGFTFNALNCIKQTNYDLDANGKRILPGRSFDRTFVVKYLFGRSEASEKLVGHMEIIYNDSPDAKYGMTSNVILSMDGEDKMIMQRLAGGYADYFAAGGKRKPKTSKSVTEITLKDGKVIQKTVTEPFDVNTETLEMTPTGEKSTIIDYTELNK